MFGLDVRVWTVLLVVVLMSTLLLGFKMINRPSCGPVELFAQGTTPHKSSSVFYVNESILFTARADNLKKVEWNFDDGSPVGTGADRKHSFTEDGDYMVTVTIDGVCREVLPVTIMQRGSDIKAITDDNRNLSPIVGKVFASAGVLETYSCNLPATKYKWIVEGGNTFEEKLGQSVSFSFSDTGTYNLTLELDDNLTKTWKQTVVVRSASASNKLDPSLLPPSKPIIIKPEIQKKDDEAKVPPPDNGTPPLATPTPLPPKPVKKFVQVPRQELENMLKDVVEKKRNVPDFENILCDGGNTKVVANDKPMTFAELCKKLQDRKGIFKSKVKDVKVTSSSYDKDMGGCLPVLYVEFK